MGGFFSHVVSGLCLGGADVVDWKWEPPEPSLVLDLPLGYLPSKLCGKYGVST